jgi:hypothetical protein
LSTGASVAHDGAVVLERCMRATVLTLLGCLAVALELVYRARVPGWINRNLDALVVLALLAGSVVLSWAGLVWFFVRIAATVDE